MRQKSILFSAFLILFVLFFYQNYQKITAQILYTSNHIKSTFMLQKEKVFSSIENHFYQKERLETLQKKIKDLEKKSSLSVAFAAKLNHLLKEANLTTYHPQLHLVQVIGYQTMQDKNRLWIDFPAFNQKKNYGLIYQGYSAGIIKEKLGQPLAILQADKESLFSVYIGKKHIQGVAFGHGDTIEIKYIQSYENPQIGDEVITSGNDKIFYEGIKVGKVIKVEKKDMYKIATVKPYIHPKDAHFFYAVEVK
jgi:rod shape-determining protein MreC